MAITLTEAAKLSNDVLRAGVIDTVANESPTLQLLPFEPVVGNGLTYNRLNVAPSAAFYDVGDTWVEGTPTFTQKTAKLSILGGDADVDNFLAATRSNIQDLRAEVTSQKAKAVGRLYVDTFINGDVTSDPNEFDGIARLCDAGQKVSMGANGGTLTTDKLDELLDKLRGGPPTALHMSRRSRRKLVSLAHTQGFRLESDRESFGMWITYYNGIPIVADDYISDAETVGTSSDCSTIYAYRLAGDGLSGLANEQVPGDASSIIHVDNVSELETKDASRVRVKMYAGLALFNLYALAALTGVRP
jgi:hypothetical protein